MIGVIKKLSYFVCLILIFGLFFTQKVNAATLASASGTLTTSRPSASAPLAATQANTTDTQVTIISFVESPKLSNSPMFLASDSAVLLNDTGQSLSTVTVASESAKNIPSTDQQILYFTGQIGATHHAGTTVYSAVTATHTIRFTTRTAIPSGGKIIITFPGTTGSTIASPSATTFSFNGITTANASTYIQTNNVTSGCTWTITAPTMSCVTGGAISANTVVTIILGCTSQSGGVCTAFSPRLINPTKGTNVEGTADTWTVTLKTQDTDANNNVDLDTANIKLATIEAVTVQATVEPYITFTIAGKANGATACGDTTDSGINATATFVNLGALNAGQVNKSAQTLTVSTNGSNGYSVTATSSGRFINPASGFYLADANGGNGLTGIDLPAPVAITAGTPAFGIHPCFVSGSYTPIVPATWGTGGGASNKYSNPWNTGTNGYYASISSYYQPASSSQTDVEYGATTSLTTPAGTYFNYFTYVATPIF